MGQFRDKEEESSRVEHLAQQAEDLPLVDQLRLLQRLAHCVEQKIDPALPALDHAPPVAAHEEPVVAEVVEVERRAGGDRAAGPEVRAGQRVPWRGGREQRQGE